jgi:hypothetical protein
VVQAQHVPGNGIPRAAIFGKGAFHIGHHGLFHRFAAGYFVGVAIKRGVPTAQEPRVVISLAADHHAVGVLQMLRDLFVGLDAAVHGDQQARKVFFELVGQLVTQRRNLAVFFRRQAIEPGITSVHDKNFAPRIAHRTHKVAHKVVALDAVNADAVLHRHRHVHHIEHGFHTVGHGAWLVHQASAKCAALHSV